MTTAPPHLRTTVAADFLVSEARHAGLIVRGHLTVNRDVWTLGLYDPHAQRDLGTLSGTIPVLRRLMDLYRAVHPLRDQ